MIMYEFLIILVALVLGTLTVLYETFKNKKWHNKPLNNFPFYYKGKLFWYSRSVATTLFTFCKNENGETCVLANLRGEGTPDYRGLWNAPCGYLDFNETGEQCARREVFEETGISVPLKNIKLVETDTNPKLNRQNISLRYVAQLSGVTTDYEFSKKNMEADEVDDIKWIPLSSIGEYEWAFNHKEDIERIVILCKLK